VRPLESVIRHDVRLDVLGNLTYGGPCKVAELSERVGLGIREVDYHLAVLLSQHLVAKEEGDLHVATLEDQPAWVEEAVTVHQLARRVTLRLSSSAMLGLKCDHCDRLLRYKQQAVAVYEEDGALRAKIVTEGTPGFGEADELAAKSKYHTTCYKKARWRSTPLPPIEPEW
jgi:DNA-binding transcriptional ArsR family regulator